MLYSCTHMATVGVKRLIGVKHYHICCSLHWARLSCGLIDRLHSSLQGYKTTTKRPPCQEIMMFVDVTQVGKADTCLDTSSDANGI